MISAVLSVILGLIGLLASAPIALPIFGLALGANAILKERKKDEPKKAIVLTAYIGTALCVLRTVLILVSLYVD